MADLRTFKAMSDRLPDFPLRELHAAAGEKFDLRNRIEALHRELSAKRPARASINSHVRELRKHPPLAALIANWFDDPRTQAFIDEIIASGL